MMKSSIKLTCVYIVAENFQKTIDFYTELFQKDVDKRFKDRWAQIRISETLVLGIYGPNFDQNLIDIGENLMNYYDENFIKCFEKDYKAGNTIVLNLGTENLEEEYKRIKKLNPEETSPIQYVNFRFPYNFFTIKDPDGNVIEIADYV